jgi:hypothetical protein
MKLKTYLTQLYRINSRVVYIRYYYSQDGKKLPKEMEVSQLFYKSIKKTLEIINILFINRQQ